MKRDKQQVTTSESRLTVVLGVTTALAYGVWKPVPGADNGGGEPLHGTFIIDRDGLVR